MADVSSAGEGSADTNGMYDLPFMKKYLKGRWITKYIPFLPVYEQSKTETT